MSEAKQQRVPIHKRIVRAVKRNNERGARESVLEELFNDFNRNRFTIYKFNFFRGIFFGLGSVLGATIVIALLISFFSMLAHIFPPLGHSLRDLVDILRAAKK